MATPDVPAAVAIPRETLDQALIMHLTGVVFDDPEMRDGLVRDFVRSVLTRSTDTFGRANESFVEKYIREGIAAEVKRIAQEWIAANEDTVKAQVAEVLEGGMVKAIVSGYTDQLADRIKRGY